MTDCETWVPAEVETLGDLHFSTWKAPEPVPESRVRFSKTFPLWLIAILAAFLGLARYILWLVEGGDFFVIRVFSGALFLLCYGAPLAFVRITRKRLEQAVEETPQLPTGVPKEALPVKLRLRSGDLIRGSSMGWVSVQGAWLVFQGDRCDFRLAVKDLKQRPKTGKALFRSPVSVRVPKGISPLSLLLFPGVADGEMFRPIPKTEQSFLPWADAWLSTEPSDGHSLLPPVRWGGRERPLLEHVKPFLSVAVIVSGAALGIRWLVRPYQDRLHPVLLMGAVAAIVLMIPASAWVSTLIAKRLDREVERWEPKP